MTIRKAKSKTQTGLMNRVTKITYGSGVKAQFAKYHTVDSQITMEIQLKEGDDKELLLQQLKEKVHQEVEKDIVERIDTMQTIKANLR